MTTVAFTINGKPASVDADADTPLLWIIREQLKLTGTKFGCGAGLCGACTVHLDGKAVRSCQTQMLEVANKKITTIEGLSPNSTIRCRKRGSPSRCRNAATASPGRSCGRSATGENQSSDARADRRAHERQYLPLRHISTHCSRH